MWNSIKRMLGLGKSEQSQVESTAAPYKVETPETAVNTPVTPPVVETPPVAVAPVVTPTPEQAPATPQKKKQPRKDGSMGKSKKAEFAFPTSQPQEGQPQKATKPRRPRNKQPKKPQQ